VAVDEEYALAVIKCLLCVDVVQLIDADLATKPIQFA
jgi:hypothetical protein